MTLLYFGAAFLLSFFVTPLVRHVMLRFDIVDRPEVEKRKIHKVATPLGGGIAIFISLFIIVAIAIFGLDDFGVEISGHAMLGLFLAGLVLMIGGTLDDIYRLSAKKQIWFPVLATFIIIGFGIGPEAITNPLGGTLNLYKTSTNIPGVGTIVWLADLIVLFWLMGMMMTTKLLDGLDGLVTGMVAIGALMIYFLSMQPHWYQPEVALLSVLFCGVLLGFLVWNWHPAKMFLGEGGSTFVGLVLGVLAIISGGKIATALLVMGIPILDIFRVLIRRAQKKQPILVGDSEHLHFKLIDSGLSQTQAVLLFYAISFLFGLTTLFLQSSEKIVALSMMFVLMLLIGIWFGKKEEVVRKK